MYDLLETPLNKIPDLSSICLYCFYNYSIFRGDIIIVTSFFGHFIFVLSDLVQASDCEFVTETDYQLSKTLFIGPPIKQ